MGYREDIRILTTKKGFDIIKSEAMKNAENTYLFDEVKVSDDVYVCGDIYDARYHEDMIYVAWDYIKWGTYPISDTTYRVFRLLDDIHIPYEFARIGESIDDIEIIRGEEYMDFYITIKREFYDGDFGGWSHAEEN